MRRQCRHCEEEIVVLEGILCITCAEKALHILPADPKERIQIYKLLLDSQNPITRFAVEQLIKDDTEMIEQNDRYFTERG